MYQQINTMEIPVSGSNSTVDIASSLGEWRGQQQYSMVIKNTGSAAMYVGVHYDFAGESASAGSTALEVPGGEQRVLGPFVWRKAYSVDLSPEILVEAGAAGLITFLGSA